MPLGPPRLVIVCEGGTEATLLEELRGHWRINKRSVEIEGEQGDPSNIVQVITDRVPRSDPHVEAWAVFDRDEHHHWSSAIERARQFGIRLAISNPCIELWGILLHRDRTAHIDRKQAQRLLKKLHKGYDHERHKYLSIGIVLDALDDADRRAKQLLKLATANGDPHGNPSTTFGELVRSLRTRARS